jgi:hypothetical protein
MIHQFFHLENKHNNDEQKEQKEKKQELVEELVDNQFTFELFSLSKYEKMAEKNPKKAYMIVFGPVVFVIILLGLWIGIKK